MSVTLVYSGQTDGWIKMPLGREVGLGPNHIVLDGDPAPSKKGATHSSPHFLAHVHCGQTVAHLSNCMLSSCYFYLPLYKLRLVNCLLNEDDDDD